MTTHRKRRLDEESHRLMLSQHDQHGSPSRDEAAPRMSNLAMGGLSAAVATVGAIVLYFVKGARDPNAFAEASGGFAVQAFIAGVLAGYLRTPKNELWRWLGFIAGAWFMLKLAFAVLHLLRA